MYWRNAPQEKDTNRKVNDKCYLILSNITVGGLETEPFCKKECKNVKNRYIFNSR
jgi:hypothetical protein